MRLDGRSCREVIRGVKRYGRIIQKSALDLSDLKHRDAASRTLAGLQQQRQELLAKAEPGSMRTRFGEAEARAKARTAREKGEQGAAVWRGVVKAAGALKMKYSTLAEELIK